MGIDGRFREAFRERVRAWQLNEGRHDLPWQHPRTPYRVWISEIMLQQTRVETVIPYFERFIKRFPDVETLARASQDEVLEFWSGLGYYARGRNISRAARQVCEQHGGALPDSEVALRSLAGIGPSTAGAILALGHGLPAPILDGNVKRVLARVFREPGWPGRSGVARRLWAYADALKDREQPAVFPQGMMDLGATICTPRRPACPECPVAELCGACRAGDPEAYPGPRPARQRPLRQVRLLALRDVDGGGFLLERRPPEGVWGGLWSLPEQDLDEDPEAAVTAASLEPAGSQRPHEAFRHGFTHFELEAHPLEIPVRGSGPEPEGGYQWFTPGGGTEPALAAPVRRWLMASSKVR